jgi:uncharacterized repeat protein (TIGR03803 family)
MRRATLIFCGIVLANCSQVTGGSSPLPAGLPNGTSPQRLPAHGYTSLYSFKGGTDGGIPYASLLDVNGILYGTTQQGGTSTACYGSGCGTVFSITTSGQERVLYSFKGGKDGSSPEASLIDVNGTLFGTTYSGGGNRCYKQAGCGTVFAVATSGKETVLHRFTGGTRDGAYPWARLIDVKGTLYGTTAYGGASDDGTVFTMSKSGAESLLYSFKGPPADGATPVAPLLDIKGELYGTTDGGGASGPYNGTVFGITTSGKETVLHSFAGGAGDGAEPWAGLIDVGSTLYGTTSEGGSTLSDCGNLLGSCGTVFAITTSGKESVFYHFIYHASGQEDGWYPLAGLVAIGSTLYGTTEYGGSTGCLVRGCGTVFAIRTSGKERVLHSFGKAPGDGVNPSANLIKIDGTLYGTTLSGGTSGMGTVFRISP